MKTFTWEAMEVATSLHTFCPKNGDMFVSVSPRRLGSADLPAYLEDFIEFYPGYLAILSSSFYGFKMSKN